MTRKCENISLDAFKKEFKIQNIFDIQLYVDSQNKSEVFNVIQENKERFRSAIYVILGGLYNDDLYGKEKVSAKTSSITAIKFKRTKSKNLRIYCKEYIDSKSPNIKKIVMICTYDKKTQKIDKKLKTVIEKIAKYEYEI